MTIVKHTILGLLLAVLVPLPVAAVLAASPTATPGATHSGAIGIANTPLPSQSIGSKLTWLQQKYRAPDARTNTISLLGSTVDLNGTTAVAGAPKDNTGRGTVYVYTRIAGVWKQTAQLNAPNPSTDDNFGASVALDGNTLLVGAPHGKLRRQLGHGKVYVFTRNGLKWTLTDTLIPSGGSNQSLWFGYSLTLKGSIAIVAAPAANKLAGAVFIFHHDNNGWEQTGRITPKNPIENAGFGEQVAIIDDSTIAIGDPQISLVANQPGTVFIFSVNRLSKLGQNPVWIQTATLHASDAKRLDYFGTSITAGCGYLVIGAPRYGHGYYPGAAYIFVRNGTTWDQTAEIHYEKGTRAYGLLGASSAIYCQGNTTSLLVGAPGFNPDANPLLPVGAAFLFTKTGMTWALQQRFDGIAPHFPVAPETVHRARFGWALALDGHTVMVGAPDTFSVSAPIPVGAVSFFNPQNIALAANAPSTVNAGNDYAANFIVTNHMTSLSSPLNVVVAIPEQAVFVSASATQGHCDAASLTVTCHVGAVAGNLGTARLSITFNVDSDAKGNIKTSALIANTEPGLSATADTRIQ